MSARLTTADLVRLNHAVEMDGLTPAEAAARWWAGNCRMATRRDARQTIALAPVTARPTISVFTSRVPS